MTVHGNTKWLAAIIIIACFVVFLPDTNSTAGSSNSKKLYIHSIKADGVSQKLSNRIREGVYLSILNTYGSRYHIVDDDAIKVMYSQAEKIMASGCSDESCITQIAEGINADEIIYGTASRQGGKVKIVMKSMYRKGVNLGTRSMMRLTFFESQLDHYSIEAGKKLLNPGYRIKKAPAVTDDGIDLKSIEVKKVKGLDIGVLRFKTSDDIIGQMLEYLKSEVKNGDARFKKGDYGEALVQYNDVLNRIKRKLLPEQQRKMREFTSGVQDRVGSTYVMLYKQKIEELDAELNKQGTGDIGTVRGLRDRYKSLSGYMVNSVPEMYKKGVAPVKEAALNRADTLTSAIISMHEKRGDNAYREFKFEDAINAYKNSRSEANLLRKRKVRNSIISKMSKKIDTARETGTSHLQNRVVSILNIASYHNLKDENDKALSSVKRAYAMINESVFLTRDLKKTFNKYAKIVGHEDCFLVFPNNPQHGQTITAGTIEFVYIKGGAFWMGSKKSDSDARDVEFPRHRVKVRGFWVGKYEVTQAQYERIMGENPSRFKGGSRPVEQVSWYVAVQFCEKLSSKYGVTARLPYESEWEYACRAGTTTVYYWGNRITNGEYCWYFDNSGYKSHPVGQKKPNRWGLYDMSGNVCEWCMDLFVDDYSNSRRNNPHGPSSGKRRSIRGGSWSFNDTYVRSANRDRYYPDYGYSIVGFRVVIENN